MSSSDNTTLGGTKQDIARIFGFVFLGIFGALIILIMTQANFNEIEVSGTLDINTIMVAFMGIVISIMGWVGITRGRTITPNSGNTPTG